MMWTCPPPPNPPPQSPRPLPQPPPWPLRTVPPPRRNSLAPTPQTGRASAALPRPRHFPPGPILCRSLLRLPPPTLRPPRCPPSLRPPPPPSWLPVLLLILRMSLSLIPSPPNSSQSGGVALCICVGFPVYRPPVLQSSDQSQVAIPSQDAESPPFARSAHCDHIITKLSAAAAAASPCRRHPSFS